MCPLCLRCPWTGVPGSPGPRAGLGGGYSEPAPRGQPCPSAPDGSESGSDPPIHISFVFPSVPVVLHTCQHWGLFYLFFFFFFVASRH